jgi:hypothetical protein
MCLMLMLPAAHSPLLQVVSLGRPDGPDALAFACGPEQVVEQALALFDAGG